jgi:hypothetical protein
VRAATHHALADPRQLHRASRVHAVAAGAVLAGHLAHARVDAHPRQRGGQPPGGPLEALVDAGTRLVVWHGVADLHGAVVEDRRAPAGQPQGRLEALLACRPHRLVVAGRHGVALGERDRGARVGDPERLGELACRHPEHERARDGRVERGIGGEGVLQESEAGRQ